MYTIEKATEHNTTFFIIKENAEKQEAYQYTSYVLIDSLKL